MRKNFKDLDLSNAFLFAAALEDEETCQLVLEIILGRSIPKVKVHSEHTILFNSNFRSVRLDVYAEDEMQVFYDLEMQNTDEKNLAKRSRELEGSYMRFEELLRDSKKEGKVEDIIELLQEVGEVSEDLRDRIRRQTNMETLSQWLKLAAKADSVEEFESKMQ